MTNYVRTVIHGSILKQDFPNEHPHWRYGSLRADEAPDGMAFDYLLFRHAGWSRCLAWLSNEQQQFWESGDGQEALHSISRELLSTRPVTALGNPRAEGPHPNGTDASQWQFM